MSLDTLLRDYARQDLKRFCPHAHYWMRDHDPKADSELVEPLLREPARFGMTPRERVAAAALSALAMYEIRSREIWSEAFPVRDTSDHSDVGSLTSEQQLEIYGRREAFRRAALVYARMLADEQLIESYQHLTPLPEKETPADKVVNVVKVVPGDATKKKLPDVKSSMSSKSRSEIVEPRVYWRVVLRDNIEKINSINGGLAVTSVIRYLKSMGDSRLPNKGSHAELFYIDEYGTEHKIAKKTVSSALSEMKKRA